MVSSSSACWPWRPLLAAQAVMRARRSSRLHRVHLHCPLDACLPTCQPARLPPLVVLLAPSPAVRQLPWQGRRAVGPGTWIDPPPPLPPAPQDYSDDACMKRFSLGQVARMQAVLQHLRPQLFASASAASKVAATKAQQAVARKKTG